MQRLDPQRGNALFLILIAVALFAALSYAVTQTGRGGADTTNENLALAAAQRADFAAEMDAAITRLRLSGCSDTQITFQGHKGTSKETGGTWMVYTNANAPADKRCHVFDPAGGGVKDRLMPADGSISASYVNANWDHPQSWVVLPVKVIGVGTDTGAAGDDLVLTLGRLTKAHCIAINNKFGITNPGGDPPVDTAGAIAIFTGSYDDVSDPIGDEVTGLQGKYDFCFKAGAIWGSNANGVDYYYTHVLIAR